jgi:hypothetical protein
VLICQALEKDTADRLKAQSVMADKLSKKQKEVKTGLVKLEKDIKLRCVANNN